MDLQGAELKALISLGDLLDNIKIIHTELEINPIYNGQCLFKNVNDYLSSKNFFLAFGNKYANFGTDFIFIKKENNYKSYILRFFTYFRFKYLFLKYLLKKYFLMIHFKES
jgi:hypothetical protein